MRSADAERLKDLIERSQLLDQRIVQLQAAITELQRRFDPIDAPARTGTRLRRPRASKQGAPS